MIKQLSRRPAIPKRIKKMLAQLDLSSGSIWDEETAHPEIKLFKNLVKDELKDIQEMKCSFCGNTLWITSAGQIEHFAPKGGPVRVKHPEFTFNTANLTLACSLCNGFEKKGVNDTVVTKNRDYVSSTFNMVHPVLDDHDLHYSWAGATIGWLTQKGKKSIEVFDLDSSHMTVFRAQALKLELATKELTPEQNERINQAVNYEEKN